MEAAVLFFNQSDKFVTGYFTIVTVIGSVLFLGLESHPQHELAKKQMSGFGGMVTFNINGNLETAKKFFKYSKVETRNYIYCIKELEMYD